MTLISTLSYAILTAIVKSQSTAIPTPVIIFIQSLVTLILILPIILKSGIQSAKTALHSCFIPLHLVRTIFSLGISYFLFFAVSYIPLVNAVLLANTAPLMVPFIAYFFMKQKMNHKLWIPILIGFAGIILVLQPDSHLFNPATLLALGAGVCMASSMLLVRKTSKCDGSTTISFYYFFLSTIISGLVAIWFWVPLPLHAWLILIGEGVLFFIVQYALAAALQNVPPEIVSSLYYSNIIFAAIIAAIFWHVALAPLVIGGIVLTCLGGILCIQVQSRATKAAAISIPVEPSALKN
jgi:drug/metabolite transporter (DMT)-like permease